VTFTLYDNSGGNYITLKSTGIVEVGNWYHILAIVEKGSKGELYVNGNKVAEASSFSSTAIMPNKADNLLIGNINGTIDEVAIWNKTLSTSEISAHQGSEHYAASDTKIDNVPGETCSGSWDDTATDKVTNSKRCCRGVCKPYNYEAKGTCEQETANPSMCNISKEICTGLNWKWSKNNSIADSMYCCEGSCTAKLTLTCSQQNGMQCNGDGSQICYGGKWIEASSVDTGKICCSGICEAKISAGMMCTPGTNLYSATCGPGNAGLVKCSADGKSYDYSGCNATGGGAMIGTGGGAGICDYSGTKVPLGYRKGDDEYCSPTGWKDQQKKDASCGNDYECKSGLCSSGKCTEVRETLALIPRIWCWLQSWILNPTSTEARQTAICSCEEAYGDPEKFETFC
jgi:hypothetical protein